MSVYNSIINIIFRYFLENLIMDKDDCYYLCSNCSANGEPAFIGVGCFWPQGHASYDAYSRAKEGYEAYLEKLRQLHFETHPKHIAERKAKEELEAKMRSERQLRENRIRQQQEIAEKKARAETERAERERRAHERAEHDRQLEAERVRRIQAEQEAEKVREKLAVSELKQKMEVVLRDELNTGQFSLTLAENGLNVSFSTLKANTSTEDIKEIYFKIVEQLEDNDWIENMVIDDDNTLSVITRNAKGLELLQQSLVSIQTPLLSAKSMLSS